MLNSQNIAIDLSGYKEKTSARVDPGYYRVRVDDVEQTVASTGSPMINLWLVISGDANGAPSEFNGMTIVDRLVLTEKALFRVVQFMQALGFPTPKQRIQIDLNTWRGRTLVVQLADGDPYRGQVKSEVVQYARAAASGVTEPAPAAGPDPLDVFRTTVPAPADQLAVQAPAAQPAPADPAEVRASAAPEAAAPAQTMPVTGQPTWNDQTAQAAAEALAQRVTQAAPGAAPLDQTAPAPAPADPAVESDLDLSAMDLSKL